MQMRIKFNGKETVIEGPCTVAELLEAREINEHMVSVQHNGTILRREDYQRAVVREGDDIKVLHFMGGGSGSA